MSEDEPDNIIDWAIEQKLQAGQIIFNFLDIDAHAESNRELSNWHRDEYYRLREVDPAVADFHHSEHYRYVGIASQQERKARGIE